MSDTFTCSCGFSWQRGKIGAHHCGPYYRQKITELERQLAERSAQEAKDAARLDFMAEHEAWVEWNGDGDSCRVFYHNEAGDSLPMLGWGPGHWRSSAREAIDAAIAAMSGTAHAKENANG